MFFQSEAIIIMNITNKLDSKLEEENEPMSKLLSKYHPSHKTMLSMAKSKSDYKIYNPS